MWRSSDAHWGDGQRRWRSRESPVSSRSPRGQAIRRARLPFRLCRIALCPNDVSRLDTSPWRKCVATAVPPKSQSCRSVRSLKISLTVPSAISRPGPHVAIAHAPDLSQSTAGRTVKPLAWRSRLWRHLLIPPTHVASMRPPTTWASQIRKMVFRSFFHVLLVVHRSRRFAQSQSWSPSGGVINYRHSKYVARTLINGDIVAGTNVELHQMKVPASLDDWMTSWFRSASLGADPLAK